MAATSEIAGRFLIVVLGLSILVSSATIYAYGSNWYQTAVLTASITQNLRLRWTHFNASIPGNHNLTALLISDLEVSNFALVDVYSKSLDQRIYLLGFSASDFVGSGGSGQTVLIPTGVGTTFTAGVRVAYTQKAVLFQAASYSGNWLWITHIAITVESGDILLHLCYRASLQSPPNATSGGLDIPPDSCEIPVSPGPGGG